MNKLKSLSKKLKKNHHKKNLDVTKEVGTIRFAVSEKGELKVPKVSELREAA